MAKRIATVSGTALVPGVSRNGRLYTAEAIAKAVRRAQDRIAEGTRPISMRSHHAAGDDSTRIVGQVTEMTLAPDGSARYRADIADTSHGRTIAALLDPEGGTPFLKGVSIRGAWLGKVRRESGPDGRLVETAPDLEIAGLDYTAEPGVDVADVAEFKRVGDGTSESDERVLIFESVQEAMVETITEETTKTEPATEAADFKANTKPPGAKPSDYADPGYQPDKKKRYLLSDKNSAKAAWSYINQTKNQKPYTGPQLKRIKQRIIKALKKFGVEVNTQEGYIVDPIGAVTETTLQEYYGAEVPEMAGSFCIELCNGPIRIAISSYCIDPADLDLIGRAAMDGACKALQALDPDMDGDIDVPGAGSEDTDSDMESAVESAPVEPVVEADVPAPEPPAEPALPAPEPAQAPEDPAPEPAAANKEEKEEPAMADSTPQEAAVEKAAATAQPAEPSALESLNAKFDKLTDAISGLVEKIATPAPAVATESAPATPAQPEQPKQVAETEEQRIERLVAEKLQAERTKIVQELAESGQGPTRKGLVAPVNEHTAPVAAQSYPEGWPTKDGAPKPMHEWTDAERREHMFPALEQYVLGSRARS